LWVWMENIKCSIGKDIIRRKRFEETEEILIFQSKKNCLPRKREFPGAKENRSTFLCLWWSSLKGIPYPAPRGENIATQDSAHNRCKVVHRWFHKGPPSRVIATGAGGRKVRKESQKA